MELDSSSVESSAELLLKVRRIISRLKGIARWQLCATTDLCCEFDLDARDMVDIIWAVKRRFLLTIPDEVPLRTPGDFVQYLHQHLLLPHPAHSV